MPGLFLRVWNEEEEVGKKGDGRADRGASRITTALEKLRAQFWSGIDISGFLTSLADKKLIILSLRFSLLLPKPLIPYFEDFFGQVLW